MNRINAQRQIQNVINNIPLGPTSKLRISNLSNEDLYDLIGKLELRGQVNTPTYIYANLIMDIRMGVYDYE